MNQPQPTNNSTPYTQSDNYAISSPYCSSHNTSNSSSVNYNNQQNYNRIKLQSNTLFAFQEYDNYSSFLENTPFGANYQPSTNNYQSNSSFLSKDSSDEYDEKDFKPIIKQNKRQSAIMTAPMYFKALANNNDDQYHNNAIGKTKTSNNKFNNYNNISPKGIYPPQRNNQHPDSLNNINDYRRFSLAYLPPYNVINNYQQNQTSKKINSFFDSQHKYSSNTLGQNSPPAFAHQQNLPLQIHPFFNVNNNNGKSKEMEDQLVLENLNTLLRDQYGCRQVQDKLDEKKTDSAFMKLFYDLIESYIKDIITNQFGNYVIQKFIDILIIQRNSELITEFFTKLQNDLHTISVDKYGTCVFQKTLEKLDNGTYSQIETPKLNQIIQQLIEKYLFPLCLDKNGNHVFQKIIRIYPKDKNQFIYYELNKYAIDISKLKQGAIILQTVLKYSAKDQKDTLIKRILSDIDDLINDEFGNYIVQFIANLQEKEYNMIILDFLKKNIIALSKKKFSSNVIDKFILPDNQESLELVQYIIDNKHICEMIVDQFGNYVVQKALNITNGYIFMAIIHQIEPVLESLKLCNKGKKIYDVLIHKYGDYFQNTIDINLKIINDNHASNCSKNVTKRKRDISKDDEVNNE